MSVTLALLGDRYKSHQFNTFTHTHLLSPSRGGWGGGFSHIFLSQCAFFLETPHSAKSIYVSRAPSESSDQKVAHLYVLIFRFPGDVSPAARLSCSCHVS